MCWRERLHCIYSERSLWTFRIYVYLFRRKI